ncbi:PepSY domain-containing protein [Thalassotalea euphylliae]|uniref:PepSY domain-containing protein n=1 Tax=Thalassotalea euphylliae TaxID=1655234 RepID=A0A3E0TMU4_9GAMM|nr:PepSY-associated TM helix domain-containing protein [Thalassotalea euphylliae]REL25889.1 PepSY domain-containing protein [Thalassotalea euphylliae]
MKFATLNRTIHKWASLVIALPLLLVIVTGILLLVRKEFAILQPPTQHGIAKVPTIDFATILANTKTVDVANVNSWQDIDRLDVRPSKGVIKVRTKSSWEVQLDSETGKVLQVAYRNSEFIESLHDGTFFQKQANLWLMLPVAIVLLLLWLTGLYLFCLPYYKKWRRKHNALD